MSGRQPWIGAILATGLAFLPAFAFEGAHYVEVRHHTREADLIAAAQGAVISPATDPHQVSLHAGNARAGDAFGTSVAISGNTMVIGAPDRRVDGHARQGAVYVFVRSASGWAQARQVAMLTVPHGAKNDELGTSVAIADNTIVAGAPYVSDGTSKYQGAAYLFQKPAAGWGALHAPTTHLTRSDTAAKDGFGLSVAASGRTIVVGAPTHLVGQAIGQGAVYVYERPAAGWPSSTNETKELTEADGGTFDEFGYSVSVSGRTIAVGAPYQTIGSKRATGSAFVFAEPVGGWAVASQSEALVANGAPGMYLGYSVAVSGSTVAVGAPDRRVDGAKNQGSAYVFTKPAGGWSGTHHPSATLVVKPGVKNAYLGQVVATGGHRVLADGYGLASVFVRPHGGWSGIRHQHRQLTGGAQSYDGLAGGLAILGHTIAAGAPAEPIGGRLGAGAVFVFRH